MPEIAEVHLNTDFILRPILEKQSICQIKILSGKYLKKKPANFDKFNQSLPAKVTDVCNRGKFIYLKLDNGWSIGIGFGMTGRMITDEPDHSHHRIEILHSTPGVQLFYNDMRNFGNFNFYLPGSDDLEKKLEKLGIDLLQEPEASKTRVVERFRRKPNWDISKALLSQEILAGVGNYVRAEALYDAKIWPYAKIKDLTDQNLYQIYQSAVKVSQTAYEIQAKYFLDGIPYQEYQKFMKIYNSDRDPEGNKVERSADTRTTWWVPKVQTIGKP